MSMRMQCCNQKVQTKESIAFKYKESVEEVDEEAEEKECEDDEEMKDNIYL